MAEGSGLGAVAFAGNGRNHCRRCQARLLGDYPVHFVTPPLCAASRIPIACCHSASSNRMKCFQSVEKTPELQSLIRLSYAGFCLQQKNNSTPHFTATKNT